jgi:hypothetical protein
MRRWALFLGDWRNGLRLGLLLAVMYGVVLYGVVIPLCKKRHGGWREEVARSEAWREAHQRAYQDALKGVDSEQRAEKVSDSAPYGTYVVADPDGREYKVRWLKPTPPTQADWDYLKARLDGSGGPARPRLNGLQTGNWELAGVDVPVTGPDGVVHHVTWQGANPPTDADKQAMANAVSAKYYAKPKRPRVSSPDARWYEWQDGGKWYTAQFDHVPRPAERHAKVAAYAREQQAKSARLAAAERALREVEQERPPGGEPAAEPMSGDDAKKAATYWGLVAAGLYAAVCLLAGFQAKPGAS